MRYPGLPVVGTGNEPGWLLAGTNLPKAIALLTDADAQEPTVEHAAQVGEALRRAGQGSASIARLTLALQRARTPSDRALLLTVQATTHWAMGQAQPAAELYERAAHEARALDSSWATALLIGKARAARINLAEPGAAAAAEALADAERNADEHLLADALRERAAWHLVRGEAEAALAMATRAAASHDSVDDRYLAGLARVLVARAMNAGGDTEAAIELMREQVNSGRSIGAKDLRMTATTFLGQFLQQAASPDSRRWVEAQTVLTQALSEVDDAFTEAELLLPLAHLAINSGDWPKAREALDDYELLFNGLGGNAIADANVAKARARLTLAELGELPHGGFRARRVLPAMAAGIRALKRAERLYERARLPAGAVNVREQRDLLQALAGGRGRQRRFTTASSRAQGGIAAARGALQRGLILERRGRYSAAAVEYDRARALGEQADSRMLAVAAAARSAECCYRANDFPAAGRAISQAVRSSETIRGAVVEGRARARITFSLRRHYERAAALAAEMGDGGLLLEVMEALRAERLAGLMRSRVLTAVSPTVETLFDTLGSIDEELARREGFGGDLRNAPTPPISEDLTTEPATPDDVVEEGDLSKQPLASLLARRQQLHQSLVAETGELFASVYDAVRVPWEELRPRLTSHVLSVVPVESDSGHTTLLAAWHAPDGSHGTAVVPVTEEVETLRGVLIDAAQGRRPSLIRNDLAGLAGLLPPPLVERLRASGSDTPLLIVPSGWTWAIPFAAIPLDGEASLIELCVPTYSASLRVNALLADRPDGLSRGPAMSFRDPRGGPHAVLGAELDALADYPHGHQPFKDAASFRLQVTTGGDRYAIAAVAAHGNKAPGLAQSVIDHDAKTVVAAVDFLRPNARPPQLLSFAVCHGMYPPNEDQYEPLGLALCALSAGATAVMSAHFEINDAGGIASGVLTGTYRQIAEGIPPSLALARSQRRAAFRREPLSRWAVLAVVGSLDDRKGGDLGGKR